MVQHRAILLGDRHPVTGCGPFANAAAREAHDVQADEVQCLAVETEFQRVYLARAVGIGADKWSFLGSLWADGDDLYDALQTAGKIGIGALKLMPGDTPLGGSNGVLVTVAACTTTALPAYNYANGTAGVGATITASAPGAFPTLDAFVALTANDVNLGVFFLQNGSAPEHNGVYMLTTQGSGGAAWVATRYSALDTAAKIAGSKVRVRSGAQSAGAEYEYRAIAAITVGTTPLYWWRVDSGLTANEGFDLEDDFTENVALTANTVGGPAMLTRAVSGTGFAQSISSANDGATIGEISLASGTTASGMGGVSDSWTAANSQPDGGGCFILTNDVSFRIEGRIKIPVLSTGAQEHNFMLGLVKQRANSQVSAADGIYVQYYRPTSASFNAFCSTAGTGSGSPAASGVAVVADTYYRIEVVKFAGDPNVYFLIDGNLVGTISANVPLGQLLGFIAFSFKTVGTTTTNVLKLDRVRKSVRFHKRRAA